jgi:hypothetical protein
MDSAKNSEGEHLQGSQKSPLLLGTVSFTVCFAAWGSISVFAPIFASCFTSPLQRPPSWSQFRSCWGAFDHRCFIQSGKVTEKVGLSQWHCIYRVPIQNEIFSEENQLIVGGATRTEFLRQGSACPPLASPEQEAVDERRYVGSMSLRSIEMIGMMRP